MNMTRPCDIVVLDYHALGRHLLLDGVVTNVDKNIRKRETGEIPGYAAKLAEDMKLYADMTSDRSVAKIHDGMHTLVPFAVEDGIRLGAHTQVFLCSLAERAVRHGRRSRSPTREPKGNILRSDGVTHVSLVTRELLKIPIWAFELLKSWI